MEKKLSKNGKYLELIIAIIFIGISVAFRFLPHPPNFTPIAVVALFGGVYLSRKMAILLPLAAMFVSDIFIGYYETGLMIAVYGSFLLCVFLGIWLKKHKKWFTILGSSILGAILFFIVTNFAVWATTSWYAKNFFGLTQCYLMAIPFFRNTLLGDLFYTVVFFGLYELVGVWFKNRIKITKTVIACSK